MPVLMGEKNLFEDAQTGDVIVLTDDGRYYEHLERIEGGWLHVFKEKMKNNHEEVFIEEISGNCGPVEKISGVINEPGYFE